MKPLAWRSLLLASGLAMAACGESPAPAAPEASVESVRADAAPPPAVVVATRDEVAEAIRCHTVLSGAMARSIASDGPPRRYGPAVRHWHAQIAARAEAAGLDEGALDALRREVITADRRSDDDQERTAFGETCFVRAPAE